MTDYCAGKVGLPGEDRLRDHVVERVEATPYSPRSGAEGRRTQKRNFIPAQHSERLVEMEVKQWRRKSIAEQNGRHK
ncbi:hypothetical protein BaRGS_00038354 [Batillaria attramentaria]|uniref:Uncharacterized protein n=1 Tax=Batillaria attramentaria TaxID=370345 RepID=A0ABD0J6E4_9CAEN